MSVILKITMVRLATLRSYAAVLFAGSDSWCAAFTFQGIGDNSKSNETRKSIWKVAVTTGRGFVFVLRRFHILAVLTRFHVLSLQTY